jgi:hypothetical protein
MDVDESQGQQQFPEARMETDNTSTSLARPQEDLMEADGTISMSAHPLSDQQPDQRAMLSDALQQTLEGCTHSSNLTTPDSLTNFTLSERHYLNHIMAFFQGEQARLMEQYHSRMESLMGTLIEQVPAQFQTIAQNTLSQAPASQARSAPRPAGQMDYDGDGEEDEEDEEDVREVPMKKRTQQKILSSRHHVSSPDAALLRTPC